MKNIKLIKCSKSITAEELADVETRFGIVFPEILKAHYLVENGGIPECRKMYFVPRGSTPSESDEVTFRGFNPIKYRVHDMQETFEELYVDLVEGQALFDSKKYIPFAYNISDFPILCDVKSGAIYFLNRDLADEDGREEIRFIASSFDEFLEGLIQKDEYEDNIYILK